MTMPRVMYWSQAPESVYAVLRECAQGISEVDTLATGDAEERRRLLHGADVLIVAAHRFTEEDLTGAPRLRLLHHQGVGYQDTTPVAALAKRGIRMALTPEGTTTGVAEHTVMLMLAVCKRLAHVDAELRRGRWHINTYRSESREIAGMVVGYIGFGRIGQAVAHRLAAFGARAVFFDPGITADSVPVADGVARALSLHELLATADIVTLHLPYSAAAHHVIDAAAIARMKRGAIVINASRGGLIDEGALHDALVHGHLAGAGLDCFQQEPAPSDHPLFNLHNVVVTPHTAAASVDALRNKMHALFANIGRWQRDEPLHNEVRLPHA